MDIRHFKPGQYREQYQYKSFSPTAINHPWYFADGQLQSLLSEADRALGELNACSQLVPDIDCFISMHITKEAAQSSRIEGTRINMEEALLAAQDVEPEKRDDWQEVQHHITAINDAIAQLEHIPLSNRLLKNAHRLLMQGVRGKGQQPGEFRVSQNWIGISLENAVFVPPHHEEVIGLMSDLEQFLHNESLQTPHLIKIAIAHYQFETIHPFLDGNGRLGRLMIALYLADFGLLHKPALYLSDYLERHKRQYVDHLMAVREAGQLKQWLIFFLHGIAETAHNSIQVFRDILQLKSRLEEQVLPHFSVRRRGNAQTLIKHLYHTPVTRVKSVAALLKINLNTASALINDFVKYGVLKEITGQRRHRRFVFEEYILIFTRVRAKA